MRPNVELQAETHSRERECVCVCDCVCVCVCVCLFVCLFVQYKSHTTVCLVLDCDLIVAEG